MAAKKFWEPSETSSVQDFKKCLAKLEKKLSDCDIIVESQKGVKPHLLIIQEMVDKKKKKSVVGALDSNVNV